MKTLLSALLLVVPVLASQAQATLGIVELPYGATLVMRRVLFRDTGQRLVCSSTSGLTIGGQLAYGTDGEQPRYKLASASLRLHGIRYQLPVSQMYNPWLGSEPMPRLFRLTKQLDGYQLWAMFSDGASGYTAKWSVAGKKAKRVLLSNDEDYSF